MSTKDLDLIGKAVLDEHGAASAPEKEYDFPGVTCISVNDEVAHGIPSASKILKAGDLVNIDISAEFGGFIPIREFHLYSEKAMNVCKSFVIAQHPHFRKDWIRQKPANAKTRSAEPSIMKPAPMDLPLLKR